MHGQAQLHVVAVNAKLAQLLNVYIYICMCIYAYISVDDDVHWMHDLTIYIELTSIAILVPGLYQQSSAHLACCAAGPRICHAFRAIHLLHFDLPALYAQESLLSNSAHTTMHTPICRSLHGRNHARNGLASLQRSAPVFRTPAILARPSATLQLSLSQHEDGCQCLASYLRRLIVHEL